MSGVLGGRYLPKGTVPKVCACGVPVYRLWDWSVKTGHYEHIIYDCEAPGSVRPKSRIGGVGTRHICNSERKTA